MWKGKWLRWKLFSLLWPHTWAVKGGRVHLGSGSEDTAWQPSCCAGSRPWQVGEVCFAHSSAEQESKKEESWCVASLFLSPLLSPGPRVIKWWPQQSRWAFLPQSILSGNTLRDRCRGVLWVILSLVKWLIITVTDPSSWNHHWLSWTSRGVGPVHLGPLRLHCSLNVWLTLSVIKAAVTAEPCSMEPQNQTFYPHSLNLCHRHKWILTWIFTLEKTETKKVLGICPISHEINTEIETPVNSVCLQSSGQFVSNSVTDEEWVWEGISVYTELSPLEHSFLVLGC